MIAAILVLLAYAGLIGMILALVRVNPPSSCTGNCNQGRACDCQGNKDA